MPAFPSAIGVFDLGSAAVATTDNPRPPTLAGFAAVVQFSMRLLHSELAQSLEQLALSASLPWGSIPLPASVVALIAPPLRLRLGLRGEHLELRISGSSLAALNWPHYRRGLRNQG